MLLSTIKRYHGTRPTDTTMDHTEIHLDPPPLLSRAPPQPITTTQPVDDLQWDEAWGGHLELWDPRVEVCHRSVTPLLNRCLIALAREIRGPCPVLTVDGRRFSKRPRAGRVRGKV